MAVTRLRSVVAAALVTSACIVVPPPLVLPAGAADSDVRVLVDAASDGDTRDDAQTELAELACAERHCCVRAVDGRVACWGDRRKAALGDGIEDGAGIARLVPGRYRALAVGAHHSCAIGVDAFSEVVCWGGNDGLQAAYDFGEAAIFPPRAYDFTRGDLPALELESLTGGRGRAQCGVVSAGTHDGDLVCWGVYLGVVATPITAHAGLMDRRAAEIRVDAGDAKRVGAACSGESHACAVVGQQVVCWGNGDEGQLGRGEVSARPEPTVVPGLADVTVSHLACGLRHTCAFGLGRDDAPIMRCFGANDAGQSGAPPPAAVLAPRDVVLAGAPALSALTAGRAHTCALTAGAEALIYCWGDDTHAQLGPDAPGARYLPEVVPLSFVPRLVTAGHDVTCVSDGRVVECWGSDVAGQLGSGTYGPTAIAEPAAISLPFDD